MHDRGYIEIDILVEAIYSPSIQASTHSLDLNE